MHQGSRQRPSLRALAWGHPAAPMLLSHAWLPLPAGEESHSLSQHTSPHPAAEKHFVFLLIISHSMCPEQKIFPGMEKHVLAAAPAGTRGVTLLTHAVVGCRSQTMAWSGGRHVRRTKGQGDADTHPAAPSGSGGLSSPMPRDTAQGPLLNKTTPP